MCPLPRASGVSASPASSIRPPTLPSVSGLLVTMVPPWGSGSVFLLGILLCGITSPRFRSTAPVNAASLGSRWRSFPLCSPHGLGSVLPTPPSHQGLSCGTLLTADKPHELLRGDAQGSPQGSSERKMLRYFLLQVLGSCVQPCQRPSALCLGAQSCPIIGNTLDSTPPGASVPGILQAIIPDWVLRPSPRDLPNHGSNHVSCVSCIAGRLFTC